MRSPTTGGLGAAPSRRKLRSDAAEAAIRHAISWPMQRTVAPISGREVHLREGFYVEFFGPASIGFKKGQSPEASQSVGTCTMKTGVFFEIALVWDDDSLLSSPSPQTLRSRERPVSQKSTFEPVLDVGPGFSP